MLHFCYNHKNKEILSFYLTTEPTLKSKTCLKQFIFHDNNLRFMPLSGVFFESLHHQSNRMTMFKKTDPNPQLDIFTAPSMQLGSRASKKYSDPNSWHNQFYSLVTTKIDEEIFKPLFPEGKKSGRPNASIRILVAMSVLKEGFGCSDEDLFEKCEFDLLTRKALGMELLNLLKFSNK